ncbi:MAG: hypothetical protein K1Y36_06660 [Blastocatellia bacterium]|nr:hypothetical protein [Blastocatellia bacterium]
MLPSEAPFASHWWGTDLESAGLMEDRPDVGTYGRYDFDRLPPLPFELKGDFRWLTELPVQPHCIGQAEGTKSHQVLAKALDGLKASAFRQPGLALPDSFLAFFENPAFRQRIRSNTDCFLDLAGEMVPSPVGDGFLIRFMADSQGCLYWYLYLTADGKDHAVVASPDYYDVGRNLSDQDEEDGMSPPDPDEIVYCAESFEAFLCRFWLENEIWFADYEGTPMPAVGQEYINRYRTK